MQAKSRRQTRRAVLWFVLSTHPGELTSHDLRREIGDEARGAIVDLMEAGLRRREGDYVRPTRAAVNFNRLEQG